MPVAEAKWDVGKLRRAQKSRWTGEGAVLLPVQPSYHCDGQNHQHQ